MLLGFYLRNEDRAEGRELSEEIKKEEHESSPSSFPGYAVSSTFASSSAFDSSTAQNFPLAPSCIAVEFFASRLNRTSVPEAKKEEQEQAARNGLLACWESGTKLFSLEKHEWNGFSVSRIAFYEVAPGASACYLRIAPWISSEMFARLLVMSAAQQTVFAPEEGGENR
ncbi:hypothetical protein CTI12_AA310900 (mitochondrion) [Artemisia annua]|uniref:Uncharacterized protein n=1 Tax=Artemisia annua TaxID=35608 RepID=A0A2U1N415_ARTAN|nr:hypothetical protein CTI12_AA310900 [Artemisia annua]